MRPAALLAALALGAAVLGCGDPELWARYRAERSFWQARRELERLQLNPRLVRDRDYVRAEQALLAIVRDFPAGRWAGPRGSANARDVAMASGRAAVGAARIEELRGHTDVALEGYARVMRDWRDVTPIALEASIARAGALDRLNREGEASSAWLAIATDYPLVDAERGEAIVPVLDAPIRVAAARSQRGDRAGADAVLAAAERRITAELALQRGRPVAPELWTRLADVRSRRGAVEAALAALRGALAEPSASSERAQLVLALARCSLDGGRPDSAFVYLRWAETGFGGRARSEAMLLTGRAFEARGAQDSALAAYQRYLDRYSQHPEAAEARFRRGVILETQGNWEQAVTEYRVLVTSQPTHELGFGALLRIVQHHAARGETDLARLEGERALEQVDRLIATQRDESVQLRARRARGELQLAMGEETHALETFSDLWTRAPHTEIGALAGIRAAALAERMNEPVRARSLYLDVESRAAIPEAQRQARAARLRLVAGKG